MDYKEFLTERKAGMRATIESMESPCLEAFKRRQREEGEKAKRSFLSFLRKRKPEVAEECEKKPSKLMALIKRRDEAYKDWAEKHPKMAEILLGIAIAGGYNASMQANQQAYNMHQQAHDLHMTMHNQQMNLHNMSAGMGMF